MEVSVVIPLQASIAGTLASPTMIRVGGIDLVTWPGLRIVEDAIE